VRALRRVLIGLVTAFLVGGVAAAQSAMGTHTVSVTITNDTSHQTFSAPVLLSHNVDYQPFALGQPAYSELVPLAEDGMTRDFVTVAKVDPAILDYAIADGPLAPGKSVTLQVKVDDGHQLLSAFGMLVTTNDTVFYYGDDLSMSGGAGSGSSGSSDEMASSDKMTSSDEMASSDKMASSDEMTSSDEMASSDKMASSDTMAAHVDLYDGTVRALDAGSEANTESCHDIPGPPCGSVGVRHTAMAEGHVGISGGLTGKGDLDAMVYGFKDPVATVVVQSP